MHLNIDKNTLLYASFSHSAGNFGCRVHNAAFQYHRLNCIYKSFTIKDIFFAIQAMKTLDIKGAGISMPFKITCLQFVDEKSQEVSEIGSANTLINTNGKITAYNTDYFAATKKISQYHHDTVVILGNGGYAKAVKYAAEILGKKIYPISRSNWTDLDSLQNKLIYNCTPVKDLHLRIHANNIFIDSLIDTSTGQELSMYQASKQFKLYTGLDFPFHIFGVYDG